MAKPARLLIGLMAKHVEDLAAWAPWIKTFLWVGDRSGSFRKMKFRIDCGATLTTVPESVALEGELPLAIAQPPVSIRSMTAAGGSLVEVRRGRLLVRFTPDEPDTPFLIPVKYVLTPPALGGAVPSLLGLGGVADVMTWHIDGRSTAFAPYGTCLLADTR